MTQLEKLAEKYNYPSQVFEIAWADCPSDHGLTDAWNCKEIGDFDCTKCLNCWLKEFEGVKE